MEIRAAGQTDAILTTPVTVESYSTVIFAQDNDGNGQLTLSAFSDNIDSIADGKSHVTIAHRAVDVSNVDVGAGDSTNNLAVDLAYGSQAGPVEVDAGTVSAGVRLTGDTGAPVITLSATLEARKHYLVVAVGDAGGNPALTLLAFELADYSISARLAFVHGVPAADLPVSVNANGQLTLFRNVK